jgi:hypothetical protein
MVFGFWASVSMGDLGNRRVLNEEWIDRDYLYAYIDNKSCYHTP